MIYTIKLAAYTELPLIQSFINNQWKQNHALVKSIELIKFQHLNPITSNYNFIIALNNQSNEIDALLGFIPTYQYDKELYNNGDYWGAIWKVRTDIKNDEIKDLGISLWAFLRNIENFHSWAAIGISKIAKKIYTILDMKVGVLNHYYCANPFIPVFKIAFQPSIPPIISTSDTSHFCIKEIDINTINPIIFSTYKPSKSVTYFINRYAKHPIYEYKFWGVYNEDKLVSLWSIRCINVNNATIIRIVDVLGNLEDLPNLSYPLQNILKKNNAEYIDFINYGIDIDCIKKIGFSQLDFNGETIIPNYFEPFEQKNVPIEFAYLSDADYVIFKADSDQDRPNIV